MNRKTVGITGGRGFLGRHISKALEKAGFKIIYFDLPEDNLVNPNPARLKRFIKGSNIIIHAAAVNRGADAEVIAGSVVATYNLSEAVRKSNPKAKIIFTSSIQAENDSVYGRSKRLAENILEELADKSGTTVHIFRFTNIFGEGGRPFYNSVVSTFASEALKGRKLPVNNPKKKLRLLYVGEAVREILKAIKSKGHSKVFLKKIDSKSEISVGWLAELMRRFVSGRAKPKTKLEKILYKVFLSYGKS